MTDYPSLLVFAAYAYGVLLLVGVGGFAYREYVSFRGLGPVPTPARMLAQAEPVLPLVFGLVLFAMLAVAAGVILPR